jgi:hypothetical protein
MGKNTVASVMAVADAQSAEAGLGAEIGRVEAVLGVDARRAHAGARPGRVVGEAVVRVVEAAFSFLRYPQRTVSRIGLQGAVGVARRIERAASQRVADGERQLALLQREGPRAGDHRRPG